MSLNKPISCCSGAIRREKPGSCWSDFTKRELPFALNPEVLLPSLGRRLSSISVWTQRELAKSLRFTTIFLGMDRRIITHLSFLSIATSSQSISHRPSGRLRILERRSTESLPSSDALRPLCFRTRPPQKGRYCARNKQKTAGRRFLPVFQKDEKKRCERHLFRRDWRNPHAFMWRFRAGFPALHQWKGI